MSQPTDTAASGSADRLDQHTVCDPPPLGPARSDADRFMRRLLRLPVDGVRLSPDAARKAFQTSLMVATVRCLLMYIVLPFVLPIIGVASGVGPWIGLPISLLAIGAIVFSIRRFWRADHSKRWHYTVFGTAVICFLCVLVVQDIVRITT
jgi:uncharacterized membrane protein SirB2